MCNAWNHSAGCNCGWGGAGRGGCKTGAPFVPRRPQSGPGLCDGFSGATVSSYLNPNAFCPECGERVYFYQSPYNGRVFFDTLAPTWDKHPCTDKGRPVRAASAAATAEGKPAWVSEGWQPVIDPQVHATGGRYRINGRLNRESLELVPLDHSNVDQGPFFARPHKRLRGFFETTYLRSSQFVTRPHFSMSVDGRLMPTRAAQQAALTGDPKALASLGRYILYGLGDIEWAEPYLRQALAAGDTSVLVDLMVIAIFS